MGRTENFSAPLPYANANKSQPAVKVSNHIVIILFFECDCPILRVSHFDYFPRYIWRGSVVNLQPECFHTRKKKQYENTTKI